MAASKLRAKDPKAAAPSKPKILVFGRPGVTKTWVSLDFPSAYYIDTEGGADLGHYTAKLDKSGGSYMGPGDGANDFAVVLEQVKALGSEKHRYKTLVIDSITKLFNTAIAVEADRMAQEGKTNGFGADKKPAVSAMRQMVTWLQKIDMNVILVAHAKDEWGKNDKGEREVVGDTFDCWDKLEYELHLALRIFKQGPKRLASVKKTRLQQFPEATLFPWSYDEFADRYGRDIIEGAVKQIILATPDQISDVKRLLDTVRVDDDFVEKCFAKAGAQSWADLDTEQIAKVIESLKGRIAA